MRLFMAKKLAYQNHLSKAGDLVTSKEQTRAGFISLALEKNHIAVPYIEEAKTLKIIASKVKKPKDLLKIEDLKLSLLTASGLSDKAITYLDVEDYSWKDKPRNISDLEKRIKGLFWEKSGKNRLLVMNINVPIVRKNVDLCLFDGEPVDLLLKGNTQTSIHRIPEKYIGLGELKGGIDPAGADEHWKTANSALNRIKTSFSKNQLNPVTFFIGAAIENNMAEEIFKQLEKEILANAGNLTNDKQLTSACDWLVKL